MTADAAAGRAGSVTVMGVAFARQTEQGAARWLVERARTGAGGWMVTANLDHLRRFRTDVVARRLLEEADVVVADGAPVVWAARLSGDPLPERVAGSSVLWHACREAARFGVGVFLLGGAPGVAERAHAVLQERIPDLRVVGVHVPPLGFEASEAEFDAIVQALSSSGAQLVLVALGFPKQDLLIERLRPLLPSATFVGIGAGLSFVAGDQRRAPRWIQEAGLEWLHRLAQEPRRLARRYLGEGLPFLVRLLVWALHQRVYRRM